jgi:hypothetical protein
VACPRNKEKCSVSEHRSRAHHVLRSLFGSIAVVGVSSLVLTGVAGPASALDTGPSGTLTINQVIDPVDDPGLFNLQIDGSTAGTGANAGNGGSTGAVAVSAGAHAVGQTAGTGTEPRDYEGSTTCTADGVPVPLDGNEVLVGAEEDVVCTITLSRVPIIVVDPHPTVGPNSRCASSRGGPNCNDDDEPIVDPEVEDDAPSTTTTTAAPVVDPDAIEAGEGDQVVVPVPVDLVLAEEAERPAPAPLAELPRTGDGVERQVTLALALMGAGIASLGLARRRRPGTQGTA